MASAGGIFPNGTRPSDGTLVDLTGRDDRTDVDFHLAAAKTARLSGRLVGPPGAIENLPVRLVPDGFSGASDMGCFPVSGTLSGADGSFTVAGVLPGGYTIHVLKIREWRGARSGGAFSMVCGGSLTLMAGDSGAQVGGPVPTDPTWWADAPIAVGDADIAGLEIPVQSGARLSGRIQFDGARPRPAPDRLMRIVLGLGAADGSRDVDRVFLPLGRVEADGTFSTVGQPPGRYILNAGSLPDGWTLAAIWFGGQSGSINVGDRVSARRAALDELRLRAEGPAEPARLIRGNVHVYRAAGRRLFRRRRSSPPPRCAKRVTVRGNARSVQDLISASAAATHSSPPDRPAAGRR